MLYNLSMASCRIEQGYNGDNTTYAAAIRASA